MISETRAFFIVSGAAMLLMYSCSSVNGRKKYNNTANYDFATPKILKLPEDLDEISGIAYYPKDTSVFAIVDESGRLYKIPLKDPALIRQWKFDKKSDFEDLVLMDSTFYVLKSNGDIEHVRFVGDKIETTVDKFSDFSKAPNEFEALYAEPDSSNLILLCKSCEGDPKSAISRFSYQPNEPAPYKEILSINIAPVAEKQGVSKHLKASAAAVHPITRDLYIISSIQKLLLVFTAAGELKELIKLDPVLYKQPEGMTFTPEGDLIISNEFAEDGFATLLLMKNKKKL